MMVITLVAALSMEATYDRVIEDPALRAKPWDLRVDASVSARAALQQRAGSGARRRRSPACQCRRRAAEFQARAVGDGFQAFPYAVPDGRMFARPGRGDRRPRLPRRASACRSATGHPARGRRAVHRPASSGATSSPTTTARS